MAWLYNTFTDVYHLSEPTYNMDKSLSAAGVHLQQGLTNPEYLRVLNKTYPTKRKDSKGMQAYEKQEGLARIKNSFCIKVYYLWILTFNILTQH